MDREGAREAVESKMRHKDTGFSARLRGMLQGCDGRDRKFETAQDEIIKNVIHKRTQDIEGERPKPMSKLRKLSDNGVVCQGVGRGMLSEENWMCSKLTAKL